MTTARHGIVCMAAGLMMVSLTGAMADAQTVKQGTAPRIQSVQGVDTYKAYCATCHGPLAKGDGPAATALKKVPADLTTIAKRNGGKFSATDVEAVIVGQQGFASHGSRDMPIWGPVFRSLAPDDSVMKMRMSNLVTYLKSIQTD
jgi:mono/diheme cytochrome c family protein